MAILLDRLFASVALGHLWVDLLNSQLGILLAYLSVPLGLTNAAIGLVSTIYMVVQSLTQPVAGYLTDRLGPRWLLAGGVLWMGVFFTLAAIIKGPVSLIMLVLASIGSGSVHPAGSSQSTLLGRVHQAGKETTTASYFFVAGQVGYFFGPLAGGPLLERFGPAGLLPLIILCLPVGTFSGWQLRHAIRSSHPRETQDGGKPSLLPRPAVGAGVIAALIGVAAFQSFLSSNFSTFIPKHLADLGQSPGTYGLMTALFMGGSAFGNIAGGYFGDRLGRRVIITTSLLAGSLPVYLVGAVGFSPLLYLLIPLAGVCNGAANTAIFVTSQRMFPGSTGMAAGLILAFMFSSGAIGTLLCGRVADLYGFPTVFYLTAAVILAGGLLGLALREPDRAEVPHSALQAGYLEE